MQASSTIPRISSRPSAGPRGDAARPAGDRDAARLYVTVGELVEAVAAVTDDTVELILVVRQILRSRATCTDLTSETPD